MARTEFARLRSIFRKLENQIASEEESRKLKRDENKVQSKGETT